MDDSHHKKFSNIEAERIFSKAIEMNSLCTENISITVWYCLRSIQELPRSTNKIWEIGRRRGGGVLRKREYGYWEFYFWDFVTRKLSVYCVGSNKTEETKVKHTHSHSFAYQCCCHAIIHFQWWTVNALILAKVN